MCVHGSEHCVCVSSHTCVELKSCERYLLGVWHHPLGVLHHIGGVASSYWGVAYPIGVVAASSFFFGGGGGGGGEKNEGLW